MYLAGLMPERTVILLTGHTIGATDELGYAAVEEVTTVHDLHATMLHQLGIRHDAFSVKFHGLDARLYWPGRGALPATELILLLDPDQHIYVRTGFLPRVRFRLGHAG